MPETEAAEADSAAEVAAEVEVKAVAEAAVAAEVEAARQFLLPHSNSVVVVVIRCFNVSFLNESDAFSL